MKLKGYARKPRSPEKLCEEGNWVCPKCNTPVMDNKQHSFYYCECVEPGKVGTHVHYNEHLFGELYPSVEFVKDERFSDCGWVKKEELK